MPSSRYVLVAFHPASSFPQLPALVIKAHLPAHPQSHISPPPSNPQWIKVEEWVERLERSVFDAAHLQFPDVIA